VLKYIGNRSVDDIEYIFLEYAPNGELFDRWLITLLLHCTFGIVTVLLLYTYV
jgi:hypothetical protein